MKKTTITILTLLLAAPLYAADFEGTASNAQLDYLTGVTSNIQTQFDAKLGTSHSSSGDHDGRYYTETEVDAALALRVATTGNETIAGVKTFSSAPIVPADAYAVGWNGNNEPAPKDAVYDKIETLSGGHDAVTLAGTPNYLTLSGQQVTLGLVDLTTDVTGLLPQANMDGFAPSATPGITPEDSDLLGADKTAGAEYWNCVTLTDGAEDCDYFLQVMQGGTLTNIWIFDESDDRFETPKGIQAGAISGTSGTYTGTLSGELGVALDTAATIDLSTAINARGGMRVNNDNDVIDYTLPPVEAGLNICFSSRYAQTVTVDADDGVDVIILDGTALTAGNAIDSAGGAGDFICLLGLDDTYWMTLGRSGTWTDGGAD